MRLHRLDLEGFGPFRERQTVDFDALAADGIFLIAGRTGAGKSSILDGVCFALYGGVPRYEGADRRVRSDHSAPEDPTRVVLEFTISGARWRVTRSPEFERPKRRGEGTTKVAPDASLEELVDGAWIGRAAGPRDVGQELDGILGLTQQQFLQVILLAQNRFSQFLLARNDERQGLLRTLFGTRVYEEYQQRLEERRRESERERALDDDRLEQLLREAFDLAALHGLADDAQPSRGLEPDGVAVPAAGAERAGVSELAAGVEPGGVSELAAGAERAGVAEPVAGVERAGVAVPAAGAERAGVAGRGRVVERGGAGERVARVERIAERADYRADTARDARDAAARALDEAEAARAERETLRDRQEQRSASRAAFAALEARAPEVAALRARLDRARSAEALRDTIRAAADAVVTADRARAAESELRTAWQATGERELGAAELRALAEELTGSLALWSDAGRRERALDDDLATQAELRERQETLAADAARAAVEVAEAEDELAATAETLTTLEVAAAALAAAEAQRDEALARSEAAAEAARLRDRRTAAEALLLARANEVAAATVRYAELVRHRLAGFAGELATALVPGEPCAVCGSPDHPAPASADGTIVTEEQLAAAERARDAALEAERAAAAAAGEVRAAHDAAVARAGGAAEGLAELLAAAETAVRAARDAATERDALVLRRDALSRARADAGARRQTADAELGDVRRRLAGLEARIAEARAAVATARGGYASVAERVADATARRERAQRLADAMAERASREALEADAVARRDARIRDSAFADAAEAEEALVDASGRDALEHAILDHDAAVRAEKQRLLDLELELADAPEELVDVAAARAAADEARAAWTRALEAESAAGQLATRLRELCGRVGRAIESGRERAAEHRALQRLADTVAGRAPNTRRMTLETFVLAAELEEIVAAANTRLHEMSGGRYRLQHTDALARRNAASGLGLEILDAYTGRARSPQSLSGGETFLASLALALGLAEVVTARAGGIRLDTLFVDEGFGSLDADTLELAMRTLDELRAGGRTVGVISHVEAMKDQLPARISVEATPRGPSVILQDEAAHV